MALRVQQWSTGRVTKIMIRMKIKCVMQRMSVQMIKGNRKIDRRCKPTLPPALQRVSPNFFTGLDAQMNSFEIDQTVQLNDRAMCCRLNGSDSEKGTNQRVHQSQSLQSLLDQHLLLESFKSSHLRKGICKLPDRQFFPLSSWMYTVKTGRIQILTRWIRYQHKTWLIICPSL